MISEAEIDDWPEQHRGRNCYCFQGSAREESEVHVTRLLLRNQIPVERARTPPPGRPDSQIPTSDSSPAAAPQWVSAWAGSAPDPTSQDSASSGQDRGHFCPEKAQGGRSAQMEMIALMGFVSDAPLQFPSAFPGG